MLATQAQGGVFLPPASGGVIKEGQQGSGDPERASGQAGLGAVVCTLARAGRASRQDCRFPPAGEVFVCC